MIGTEEKRANSSTVAWEKVRRATASTQRARLRATSQTGSRSRMRCCPVSMNTLLPPSIFMPSSKVKRVRRERFSKITASDRPSSAPAERRGSALTAAGQPEQLGDGRRAQVVIADQVGRNLHRNRRWNWGRRGSRGCGYGILSHGLFLQMNIYAPG